MVQYGIAIKRPFTDIKKLVIGFLLNILPIVNFLVIGYQLECAKTAMNRNFKLPDWKNWGELFIRGLLNVILVIIYAIPFFIVLAILGITVFTSLIEAGITQSPANILSGLGSAIGGSIILVIIGVLTVYILPLAVLSYVEKWRFGDIFAFGKILSKAFTTQYFVAWILLAIYGFILSVILSIIPFFGGALSGYIVGVTALTVFGEIYPSL